MALSKRHSIYLWNVQLLNCFGIINLQIGTTLYVQETLALEKIEIIYGVLRHTSSCLTLNHLIIIGKYFLCTNGVHDEKRPQFTDFITLVYEKIELEKYIAITTNKLLFFNKKMVQLSKHLIINYIN